MNFQWVEFQLATIVNIKNNYDDLQLHKQKNIYLENWLNLKYIFGQNIVLNDIARLYHVTLKK